jgi:anti-anti-sigma regulatory factor
VLHDQDRAGRLRTALCETVLTERPQRVRVDLAGVPLTDAVGLRALVAGLANHRYPA